MGRYNIRESLRERSPATNLVFSRDSEIFDNITIIKSLGIHEISIPVCQNEKSSVEGHMTGGIWNDSDKEKDELCPTV